MSGFYTGRGPSAGPVTEFLPLSGATASAPAILISATTPTGGGTTIHTADANAQDVLYVTFSNITTGDLIAYGNLGTAGTSATGADTNKTIPANGFEMVFNANAAISKSGVVSAFTTASVGMYAYGFVARTFTATAS